MAGRIGLISTAVSTKDTGYMNHRLIKMLEDLKVAQDGSVRDSRNRLYQIQFQIALDQCLIQQIWRGRA